MKGMKQWLSLAILLAVAGVMLYGHCTRDAWREPRVVTFVSEEEAFSMFPTFWTWGSAAEPGALQALLLREGDLIVSDDLYIRYRIADGQQLDTEMNDWNLRLAGKVVALSLDDEDGVKWLEQATDEDLAHLRTIELSDDEEADATDALRRIAALHPNIDLLSESVSTLRTALEHFKPRTVILSAEGEEDDVSLDFLANQPELDTLYLATDDETDLAFLVKVPKLNRLALFMEDTSTFGTLPEGIVQLASLIVFQARFDDLARLKPVADGLEELTLIAANEQFSLKGIERFANLRALTLVMDDDDKPLDLSPFKNLTKLRWVGLPGLISQQQFADFVDAHPRIEVLELMEREEPLDLEPLRGLRNLQGLVLHDGYENLEVLKELRTLRYLGISTDLIEDSPAQVAAIRQALPDAVVVRIAPYCLGSGWILLLIPVLAFAWSLRHTPGRMPATA